MDDFLINSSGACQTIHKGCQTIHKRVLINRANLCSFCYKDTLNLHVDIKKFNFYIDFRTSPVINLYFFYYLCYRYIIMPRKRKRRRKSKNNPICKDEKKKMKPSLDINKKMVIADHLEKEPKPSKSSKPYERKKETNIKLKGYGLYPLRTDIDPKLKMNPTNFSELYKVSKTKYENLFPTFYNITKNKKEQFESSVSKIDINNLKMNKNSKTRKKENPLIRFWQNFFKFLSSLFYNENDKYKDIKINSDGFQSIYEHKNLGNFTIGKGYLDIEGYALGKFNQDFHHNYLTPKITTANGELHLMPIYDDFNGNGRYFYDKFLEQNKEILNIFNPSLFPNIGHMEDTDWAQYDENSVNWFPELTHDTYERFLTDNHIKGLGYRPWVSLRYALNYYADNYTTYEYGILIDVNVFSVDNILSLTLDSGIGHIKLGKPIEANHANLLIAHISKKKKKIVIK